MSSEGIPAAPAADLDEAGSLALFESLSNAKTSDDPIAAAVKPDLEDDGAAASAAAPAEVPAIVPAAAAPAAAATDIWQSATPELRAAHDAALAKERQRYSSDIGRQAAHQATIQALRDQLAARDAPPAASTASPAATPVSLRERPDIKKVTEDYPDVVGPLLDVFEPVIAENARLGRELSTITEDRRAGVLATQEAALAAVHPDWVAACASKDFADWLAVQPDAFKQVAERNGEHIVDAAEAIAMVGNFKAHFALTHPAPVIPPVVIPTPVPTLSARREAQLAAVTSIPKGAPAAIPDGAPGGGDQAMFDHYVQKKAQKG